MSANFSGRRTYGDGIVETLIHIHGKAHRSTPTETSRTSLRLDVSTRRACVQSLRNTERCGNRICSDPAFHFTHAGSARILLIEE
jgi:hypothetical protein